MKRILATIILTFSLAANAYENQYPNNPQPNYDMLIWLQQQQQLEVQREILREQQRQQQQFEEERKIRLMQDSFNSRYW